MVRIKLFLTILFFGMVSDSMAQYIPKFDLQGHRGARGMKPENTIPAFLTALDAGVTTLELDVVISKDKKVVVSHEPWMSSEICVLPDSVLKTPDKVRYNIYKMAYEDIRLIDCGSKHVGRFPEQEKLGVSKPLLEDVIIVVERHIRNFTQYEVDYNIEIKSTIEGDGKFHPAPEEFSDIVYELINQYLPMERVVIQSFDFRVLKYWHTKFPNVRLAALVENTNSISANLASLGFNPSIYSPYYILLTKEGVDYLHQRKIRVIPWTINDPEQMKKYKTWGVDGIITDYPNRASEIGLGLQPKPSENILH